MNATTFREKLNARRAHQLARAKEQSRSRLIRAYLGDGAGTLAVSGTDQMYYVRKAGNPDEVIEARWQVETWLPMLEDVVVWLREWRGNGVAYYEIVGEAPGTSWQEPP